MSRPGPAGGERTPAPFEPLRRALYQRFRQSPDPVLSGPGFNISAGSLWAGARAWVAHLRRAGLGPGDAVAVALDPGPAMVEAVLACWWEGLAVRPEPALVSGRAPLGRARLRIAPGPAPHTLTPGPEDIPAESDSTTAAPAEPGTVRWWTESEGPPALLRAGRDGDRGGQMCAGELLRGMADVSSRLRVGSDDTVVCAVPLDDPDGHALALWPALMTGARVVLDPQAVGRGPAGTLMAIHRHRADAVVMPGATARALADLPGGEAALASMRGAALEGAVPSGRARAVALAEAVGQVWMTPVAKGRE